MTAGWLLAWVTDVHKLGSIDPSVVAVVASESTDFIDSNMSPTPVVHFIERSSEPHNI